MPIRRSSNVAPAFVIEPRVLRTRGFLIVALERIGETRILHWLLTPKLSIRNELMRTTSLEPLSIPSARKPGTKFSADPDALIQYFGAVNYATSERVLHAIQERMQRSPGEEIFLTVTSAGGPTGTAMSFYDTVRAVLRPNLVTIGAGDVDSSGILIFLAGTRRFVTKHTTLLLHRAGRTFDGGKRFTAADLKAMFEEDELKDMQYASVVAHNSGSLTTGQVLRMMDHNTILTPEQLVAYGLADAILE